MTHVSSYGYDLFTLTVFMTVIGHKVAFGCISFLSSPYFPPCRWSKSVYLTLLSLSIYNYSC